jgi:SPP1 gp7 family putative phage head morphogenesis protein
MNIEHRASSSDFLFDLERFKKAILAAFRIVGVAALDKAGQELFEETGVKPPDDPWKMPSSVALQYLQSRENRLANASDEVWERIKTQLDEGLRKGEPLSKLADRIRAEFTDIGKADAMRIASTETSAAYGVARQEAMKEAGVKFKQWLTSGLPNVRPAHRAAEGQIVKVDEPFLVGGEYLMHPGDPSGSAGNVINCHCVSIAVAEGPKETAS